ncbi:ABC transporter ATP-binding protein/permease [Geomonas subterranea]|uniref:ABC transporter ATP-binding protein/permease n=1 Tax=Geomonas subterranea TaxID=2847989 RepID=A0ABX8LKD1_9BACT|nr:ABC transporter ATP-binding protein [Geomonas subterranea]QXE90015.1 ABC transporter ATP-binding protein/permease [Geomonas subterranea]QXM07864.1 ABC transporter ATP-binding protein/permease [Geomonas subterranea]
MHFGGIYEEETVGKVYDRRLMGRFVAYVVPYRRMLITALLMLPLIAASKLAQPWIIKVAIDEHIVKGRMAGLPALAAAFLAVIFLESILMFGQVYLLQWVGQRVMYDIRVKLFSHIQRLSTRFFDQTPVGSLVSRLTSDIEVLGEMFAAGLVTVVGDILVLAGIVGIMLWMNVRLSLVTFSVLPVLIWVAFAFRKWMRLAFRQVRARQANLSAFLAESIGGMAVVQLFNREHDEAKEFRRLNASYVEANLPVITWDAALYAVVESLSSVAVALIIWYGGGEIVKGTLSFGSLVAFIQYIEKFFSPIRDLSAKYSIMQGAMASLERIFALLDNEDREPASLPVPEKATGTTPPCQGAPAHALQSICFNDIWFAYKERDYVLKGFSLQMKRGEKVALVGETGGGKTTVTRLLSRLYDVERGSITIDGTDIRELPLPALRKRIGVVLQDPYLFSGTIAYNISLGDPEALKRVEQAAAVVGADRFIRELPKGYEEEVRERGVNFSAGERQLISFARAVAFDPEILVLDEATASVDTASERLIQQGLEGLMQGRTTLVVAHRLSTIRDADRIVVIHRGEKVEEGTHAELMAAQGVYYRLYQLQFKD